MGQPGRRGAAGLRAVAAKMWLRRDTDRAHGPDCAYSRWRNGADGLERRPLVGTAARRAAGGSSPSDFTGRGYGAPNCAGGLPFQCTDHAERWGFRRDQTTSERRVRPAARLRRAVPAGGRRSKPVPATSSLPRFRPRRELSRRSGFVPPPACGGLCRSEDRRSKPSPRPRSGSDARFPLSPVTCAAAGYPPAVQPAAGLSNQMCTCPVPTAFSYFENSRPGAEQSAPPAAATAIR